MFEITTGLDQRRKLTEFISLQFLDFTFNK